VENSLLDRLKDKFKGDEHLSSLVRGSAISFIFKIIGLGAGYAFILLITRGYGPEVMGVFALSLVVLQITSVIARLGMDTFLLRSVAESTALFYTTNKIKETYKEILLLTIPFSILISCALYYLAPFISEYVFHKSELITPLQYIALGIVPMTVLFLHREAIRGLKRMVAFSFIDSLAVPLFASIILITLIYFSDSEFSPIYAHILSLTFAAIFSILIWTTYVNQLRHPKLNNDEIKETKVTRRKILATSFPMMLSGSLFLLMGWVDTFMIGMYRDISEVGVYSVALKVSALTSIILISINSISAPKFAEMWGKGDLNGLKIVTRYSTKLIFWGALPILLFILLFPGLILKVFGVQFELAITALVLLSLGQFINSISGSVNYLLNMTGHEKVVLNNITVALLINIVLNYILIPLYGIDGAALASLMSMAYWNFAGVIYIKYKLGFWTIYIPFIMNKGEVQVK
jgi:O-antigen/teichoic acid export membrane protein